MSARKKNLKKKNSRRVIRRGAKGAFREEVVRLHRRIFRANKDRINASVHGYSESFRRYERAYQKYVRTYERRAPHRELDRAISKANVVYVGDYHTLPQAQEAFSRLLQRVPSDRPVVVALEFFRGKYQAALEAYMAGELDEPELLHTIGYRPHCMLGDWDCYKPILQHCADRGIPLLGIDSTGRGAAGDPLNARDAYAARRIVKALRDHESNGEHPLVLVLIGELHIAPCHLPRQVQRLATARGLREIHDLVLYQNCERVYWALEERGLEHEVDLVRVGRDQYCLINTPPIVCQQSFLNWLDIDDDAGQLLAPEQNFKEFTRLIAAFFDLPLGDALDEVEITTVIDLSFLGRLQRRGDFSTSDMRYVRRRILRSESCYIPRAKMVYLGNLSVNHAAEEATHFLRHVCADCVADPRLLVDAFYARCLEEAVGFLGSKIINHRRWCPDVPYYQRLARSRTSTPDERQLGRFVTQHAKLERGERARSLSAIYECDADMFDAVTHAIGYRLGNKLYHALLGGLVRKHEIRDLFFDGFEEEGAALTAFLYINARVIDVRVPLEPL